ncbi:MAG: cation:proton antiporter [Candidatus Dormibacteria bacterium]
MFRELALLVGAGLMGPLLARWRDGLVPVVVGELAMGAVIGNTGFRLINPRVSAFPVLYGVGFAMLMLTAGTHVDVRSKSIRSGALRGLMALAAVLVVSVPVGFAIGTGLGIGHQLLLIVLLAGSSAAVAFPIIEERHLKGVAVAYLTAWIALADSLTVVLMPLGLTGPAKLVPTLLGDAAVILTGVAVTFVAYRLRHRPAVQGTVAQSIEKGWAVQLRLSVLLLLSLAAVAQLTGASILVAGFTAGMALIYLGEPDRLGLQISGLANGFFVPIFFVLLGAELDLRALVSEPRALLLAAALAAGAVAVHLVAALVTGPGQKIPTGLAASAQLGLPAAAATLAISSHALSPANAAALVAAGCLSLAPATIGAARLAGSGRARPRT